MRGRPKGSRNKSTDELRNALTVFLTANLKTLQSDFDKLMAKDRLAFIERVARLVMPAPIHELDAMSDEQFEEFVKHAKEGRNLVNSN